MQNCREVEVFLLWNLELRAIHGDVPYLLRRRGWSAVATFTNIIAATFGPAGGAAATHCARGALLSQLVHGIATSSDCLLRFGRLPRS
jgi:hypothetical protein